MTERFSLTVARYTPKDPSDRDRLGYINDQLKLLLPEWVHLKEVWEQKAQHMRGPGPPVKELITQAHRNTSNPLCFKIPWWGTISQNVLVTRSLFARLHTVPPDANIIIICTWDIPYIPWPAEVRQAFPPQKRHPLSCVGGVFLNAESQKLLEEDFPKGGFSEGLGVSLLACTHKHKELIPYVIDEGEALCVTKHALEQYHTQWGNNDQTS
jgi:hypothetical protein